MRGFRFREAREYTVKEQVETGVTELNEPIIEWQGESTIMAEVWPLQGNQSRGEMGVTEDSTHKAFSSDPGAFKSNTRLIDSDGNIFLVGFVPPGGWKSHGEAVLEYVGVVSDED